MCWPLARHILFAFFSECLWKWRCDISWVWAHGRVQSAANVGETTLCPSLTFDFLMVDFLMVKPPFFKCERPDPLCQRDSSCHRRWRQCRREMHRWKMVKLSNLNFWSCEVVLSIRKMFENNLPILDRERRLFVHLYSGQIVSEAPDPSVKRGLILATTSLYLISGRPAHSKVLGRNFLCLGP